MKNNVESNAKKKEEIVFITMDVIDECLEEAIEKVEHIEYKPC